MWQRIEEIRFKTIYRNWSPRKIELFWIVKSFEEFVLRLGLSSFGAFRAPLSLSSSKPATRPVVSNCSCINALKELGIRQWQIAIAYFGLIFSQNFGMFFTFMLNIIIKSLSVEGPKKHVVYTEFGELSAIPMSRLLTGFYLILIKLMSHKLGHLRLIRFMDRFIKFARLGTSHNMGLQVVLGFWSRTF